MRSAFSSTAWSASQALRDLPSAALRGRYVENLNYFSKVNHEGTGSARWDIWLEMLVIKGL